jgi:hypothetical protein
VAALGSPYVRFDGPRFPHTHRLLGGQHEISLVDIGWRHFGALSTAFLHLDDWRKLLQSCPGGHAEVPSLTGSDRAVGRHHVSTRAFLCGP